MNHIDKIVEKWLKLVYDHDNLRSGICLAVQDILFSDNCNQRDLSDKEFLIEYNILKKYLNKHLPPRMYADYCQDNVLWSFPWNDILSRKQWIEKQLRSIKMKRLFDKIPPSKIRMIKSVFKIDMQLKTNAKVVAKINFLKSQINDNPYVEAMYWYYIYNFKAKK